jgi:hypothetical protein
MVQMRHVIVVAKRHLFSKSPGRSVAIVTTMDEAVFHAYIAEFNAAAGARFAVPRPLS